jgi:CDP-diacylglycerol---serine O-phosphatidyltransferase
MMDRVILTDSPEAGGLVSAKSWAQMALPNAVTVLALWAGLSGLLFAADGETGRAVACVIAAAFIDACDGRVARITGTASRFGAELDSLSDVVCFGAVPAFILHAWGLQDFGGTGWLVCLLLAAAAALRLARFNVIAVAADRPAWAAAYFQGVPAPAGAFLALLPIYAASSGLMTGEAAKLFALVCVPVVAALMVSRIPTFSGKALGRLATLRWFVPSLLAAAVLAATLVVDPWSGFMMLATLYLFTLPLSLWRYQRRHGRANPPG